MSVSPTTTPTGAAPATDPAWSDPAPTTQAAGPGAEPPRRAWTLVLASLGVFMTALDTLVVANALPALRASLHADLGDLEWTVNAYNLAFAVALLTGAALGDRFGRKRIYWIGLLGFTVASAAAALSPSVGVLIAARGVQGMAAAAVMPMTLTLISEAFPADRRGAAIGLWGGITGLAVALGPVVGGAIVGGISWHWIFWLNVPVGLALVPLSIARLRESFGARSQLDIVGLLLAAAGFFGITWGLIRTNRVGWASGQTIGALAVGIALVGAFLVWERRTATPMLSVEMFRSRAFNAANGVSFFMYASLFGVLFLMMQFLQTGLGYSPLAAGLRTLPWTGAPMVVAPIAGALADRFGNRPFLITGLALQAVGLGWIAAIAEPGMSYRWLAVALAVAGVGISLCFPTVANAVVGSVPPTEMGIASGTNSAVREIGGVFGVAILASVFAGSGVYTSTRTFVDHFATALWIGAAFSAVGILAAAAVPGRHGHTTTKPASTGGQLG
ncbi:DHA2 family efflux MFS transporter permease subunit [Frankia sp. AgB1.9]|uniref:DHA2 family efflux MFS transporter permease subunit n=1 Tax=unclassified Frankia TaxID=2632575 RepID=UPI0019342302|nr:MULTISPECIES: DHA2 family efflux MFS transporter permease subunit [unclassified Frankia]MBL7490127.1 DHA2 family efflux MFS transporter permease subunit [Frankia sp. AgW1.1]MBL7546510.1 DHA2 family efflux MFS transporter permease subunit [Frankia sp. AgB1.9]MBL7620231.1 DHA2 family efflux MFS transporter permease subunit [Frankia sp. AgB1.8]